MPICFITCGIIFIFILFGVFNASFFNSKQNFSVLLLYVATQIFSFFVKDFSLFNVSIVYFVPALFFALLLILNIKQFNFVKMLTISLFIATLFLAIGFIDTAFLNFIEHNLLTVCSLCALISFIFSKNISEALCTSVLGYALFLFGIIFKQSVTLSLTDISILNCLTTTILFVMLMQLLKNAVLNSVRRIQNAKIKKV